MQNYPQTGIYLRLTVHGAESSLPYLNFRFVCATSLALHSIVRSASCVLKCVIRRRRTMTGAEIEDRIRNPKTYKITKIQVLRARGQLPENEQVGATCGIYALQAAFDIKGLRVAPRKRVFGDWRSDPTILRKHSIRGKAKEMGLTKIGEIGG